MLGSILVTLALAPTPSAAPGVAVLPLRVQGELPERWHGEARGRLVSGLARGELTVHATEIAAGDCAAPECWTEDPIAREASFVVASRLTVGEQRDYAVAIDVMSARTGSVVASIDGTCELCGFEEAVAMIEQRAAVVAPELVRLAGAVPVLGFSSDPDGVTIQIDGKDYGPTPLSAPLPAGPHRVVARKRGYLEQTFEIEAVDGVTKDVQFRLVEAPADPLPRGRGLIITGSLLIAGGVGGLVAGGVLLGIDGEPYRRRCEADALGTCQFDYETTTGGAIGTALGGAGVVAGAVCLGLGLSRRSRARRTDPVRISPAPGGLRLTF